MWANMMNWQGWAGTAAVNRAIALRRTFSDERFFHLTTQEFKSAWARAMTSYLKNVEGSERFAEADLRAMVATKAMEEGKNATSMLGHSSDQVTRRHYQRGTVKVTPLE